MSDYSQSTFFTAKDSLTTGDPLKIVRGSEVDGELDAISTAIATKVDQVGAGLSLASKTISLSFTGLTAETTVTQANDLVAMYDASAAAHRKVTVSDLVQGWSANRTVTAGVGLSGGGTLDGDITLTVDLNELTTETTAASGDFVAMVDITDNGSGKITFANLATVLEGLMSHDDMTGFVADEHVAHAGVSIVAGSGLTGGGTIAASRTLNVGAGTGITVNADDVAIALGKGLMYASAQTSSLITIQSGGSPTGGSNGDIYLIY